MLLQQTLTGLCWSWMRSNGLKPSGYRVDIIKVYWSPCSGTYQYNAISKCFPMTRSSCCVLLVRVFVVSRQHRLPPSSSVCYSAVSTMHGCGWFCGHNNMNTLALCTTQSKQSCFCVSKINMIAALQNQSHAYKPQIQASQGKTKFSVAILISKYNNKDVSYLLLQI